MLGLPLFRSIGTARHVRQYSSSDGCAKREQRVDHRTWPDDHSSALHIAAIRHFVQVSLPKSGCRRHSVHAHGLYFSLVYSSIDQFHALRAAIDVLFSSMATHSGWPMDLGIVGSSSATDATSINSTGHSELIL